MQDLTITIVQDVLDWEDPTAGRARFHAHLEKMDGTDLVVLPEMFTTGFTMSAAACAEDMDGRTVTWMREQALRTGAVITGSLIVRDDDTYRNRLVWAAPDGDLQHYDKRHLFRFAGEDAPYTAGTRRVVVQYRGWRIVPLICYDLRFPVWSRYAQGCDLLLFVANWPSPRHSAWSALLRARAIENQCYLAGVNRVGTDGLGIDYLGGSVVLDYFGNPLADCRDAPGVDTVCLRRDSLAAYRQKFPACLDADRFEIDLSVIGSEPPC